MICRPALSLLDELVKALLATPPAARTTYAEAFQRTLGIRPTYCDSHGIGRGGHSSWRRCAKRNTCATIVTNGSICCLATRVEPQLGRDRPEILYHYPASQASLAKVATTDAGYEVAERFELYFRGIELANGFHELGDAAELRRRFEAANTARVADGRGALPLPESLLAALEHGLPSCTGCALVSIGWSCWRSKPSQSTTSSRFHNSAGVELSKRAARFISAGTGCQRLLKPRTVFVAKARH